MELMKKHKMHILLPVILMLVSLVGGLVYNSVMSGGSAAGHVSLGQQYLNSLDYSAAIMEFSNAIELDPTNIDARIGLAEAYCQTGNYEFAADVLEDVINEGALDPDIAQQLIEIYEEGGNYSGAVDLIVDLIHQTDEDEYYDQLRQTLAVLYDAPHAYAQGMDQQLMISGGSVQSAGMNTLGQLGTDGNLGSKYMPQDNFDSSGFTGNAMSVYCVGRTSFVLDENHDLWAAGENRWGQMGLSYGSILPESGWVRITDTGDVAAVAGSSGYLMLLKADGTLWECGDGRSQTLEPVSEFGTVLQIYGCEYYNYVLTAEGYLYCRQTSSYGGNWYRIAASVAHFTADGSRVYWVTTGGGISCYYDNSIYFPDTWEYLADGSVKPDFNVCKLAFNGNNLFLLGMDGKLYKLDGYGNLTEISVSGAVVNLYTEHSGAVAVLEDGTILRWESYSDDPVDFTS